MSATTRWIRIGSVAQVPRNEGRAVIVDGQELAIFNLGDRFLAVDGRCPHRGGPLCDGIVAGQTVICPLHAWKIDLTSGSVERPTGIKACVHTYATRIDDGVVSVEIDGDGPAAGNVDGREGSSSQAVDALSTASVSLPVAI